MANWTFTFKFLMKLKCPFCWSLLNVRIPSSRPQPGIQYAQMQQSEDEHDERMGINILLLTKAW